MDRGLIKQTHAHHPRVKCHFSGILASPRDPGLPKPCEFCKPSETECKIVGLCGFLGREHGIFRSQKEHEEPRKESLRSPFPTILLYLAPQGVRSEGHSFPSRVSLYPGSIFCVQLPLALRPLHAACFQDQLLGSPHHYSSYPLLFAAPLFPDDATSCS